MLEEPGSLAAMFDGEETALINGVEIRGHFDTPQAGDFDIDANTLTFLCEQAALDQVGTVSTFVIDAVPYTVRRVERGDDTGKESLIVLAAQ